MVPVRELAAGLFAAINVIVPFPEPEAPDFMLIHAALLVAVQLHPAAVATAIEAVNPPVAGAGAPSFSVYVQVIPICVTVNVNPAMVSVPERAAALVLAAMLYPKLEFPMPAAALVIVIHGALLLAAHPQLAAAVTTTA